MKAISDDTNHRPAEDFAARLAVGDLVDRRVANGEGSDATAAGGNASARSGEANSATRTSVEAVAMRVPCRPRFEFATARGGIATGFARCYECGFPLTW